MTKRIQLSPALPDAFRHLAAAQKAVETAARDAGLDMTLIELVKIRASQLNGCAYCIATHTRDARALGLSDQKMFLLPAWHEADLYDEQERAALALTEAMTKLAEHQDVSDGVYEQATKVFTKDQYAAVAWAATLINALNRLGVTSRPPLPKDDR